MANTLAILAAVLRLGFGVNKYLLWGGLGTTLYFTRPYLVGDGKMLPLRIAVLVGLLAYLGRIGKAKIEKYSKLAKLFSDVTTE